jgi:hypothetical protein
MQLKKNQQQRNIKKSKNKFYLGALLSQKLNLYFFKDNKIKQYKYFFLINKKFLIKNKKRKNKILLMSNIKFGGTRGSRPEDDYLSGT